MTTGRDWFETERPDHDEEQDVNTSDIQGFAMHELEALSAGLDDNPSGLANTFTCEEAQKPENARQAEPHLRDKMKGKGDLQCASSSERLDEEPTSGA